MHELELNVNRLGTTNIRHYLTGTKKRYGNKRKLVIVYGKNWLSFKGGLELIASF